MHYWRGYAVRDGAPVFESPDTPLGHWTLIHSDFFAPRPNHDGEIALVSGGGRESLSDKHLALVDASTAVHPVAAFTTNSAISPAWSPDGSLLATVIGLTTSSTVPSPRTTSS